MHYIPPTIQAGVTFTACAQLTKYPAPDWVVKLYMRGPAVASIDAVGEGASHTFSATAAETAAWPAGVYAYVLRVQRGDDVQQIEAGTLEVLADITANTAPGDSRSHALRTLEAIEAVLEKRATRDQERYTIEGANGRRELWRTPIADLLKLRDAYRAEVRAERAAARGKSLWGAAVKVRF